MLSRPFSVVQDGDITNACMLPTRLMSAVQTSEPTSKLCNVSYRVWYRDNYIGRHIVSWKNVDIAGLNI